VNALFGLGASSLMLTTTAPMTKLLLAAGASVSAADSAGMTVLHHHARAGISAGVVCLTIQAGADPTALDKDGSTPAHVAGMSGHFALEALLSRAAEDYRKKHPAVAAASSSSGDASGTAAAAGDRHSESTVTVSSGSGTTTNSSITGGTGITAAISSVASKECQERTALVNAVTTANNKQLATTAAAAVCVRSQKLSESITASTTELSTGSNTSSTSSTTAHASSHTDAAQQTEAAVGSVDTLLGALTVQQQQPRLRKAKQPCANCKQPTGKLCRRCVAVYYCSVECQKACFSDAQHRAQCEATAAAQVS
jgi:hypothetical protein